MTSSAFEKTNAEIVRSLVDGFRQAIEHRSPMSWRVLHEEACQAAGVEWHRIPFGLVLEAADAAVARGIMHQRVGKTGRKGYFERGPAKVHEPEAGLADGWPW